MPTGGNKTLVLAAMIFAVSMTFIDQTIVALAIPDLQKDLGLSATGTQWIINAYLLSLSPTFWAPAVVISVLVGGSRSSAKRRPARTR